LKYCLESDASHTLGFDGRWLAWFREPKAAAQHSMRDSVQGSRFCSFFPRGKAPRNSQQPTAIDNSTRHKAHSHSRRSPPFPGRSTKKQTTAAHDVRHIRTPEALSDRTLCLQGLNLFRSRFELAARPIVHARSVLGCFPIDFITDAVDDYLLFPIPNSPDYPLRPHNSHTARAPHPL
jgi:hypothetical protein